MRVWKWGWNNCCLKLTWRVAERRGLKTNVWHKNYDSIETFFSRKEARRKKEEKNSTSEETNALVNVQCWMSKCIMQNVKHGNEERPRQRWLKLKKMFLMQILKRHDMLQLITFARYFRYRCKRKTSLRHRKTKGNYSNEKGNMEIGFFG